MSWIREDAQETNGAGGMNYLQAAIFQVMSINPDAQAKVRDLVQAVTFGGSILTRVQEEAIATAVSVNNHCRY